MMRAAVALVALLMAGCTAGAGATAEPSTPAVTAAPITPAPATSSVEPSAPPSESPADNTVFTPDDTEIATLITAAVDEAVPQLAVLNDSDPSKLEDLFLPLGEWISAQRTDVEALTPSSCTTEAVDLFEQGLSQYDAIRKKFLAWRDWGANGNAFPPGAPREASDTLKAAVDELGAHCST
jgi:hypothetical protein